MNSILRSFGILMFVFTFQFCVFNFHASAQESRTGSEGKLAVRINLNSKSCTFTISIQNNGIYKIKIVDTLRHYGSAWGAIPFSAMLHFRSSENLLKNADKTILKQGYTFASYQADGGILLPAQLVILSPKEKIEKTFNLERIAPGLLPAFGVSQEILTRCEMMMSFRVYFDGDLKQYEDFESDWILCPECVIAVNGPPKAPLGNHSTARTR